MKFICVVVCFVCVVVCFVLNGSRQEVRLVEWRECGHLIRSVRLVWRPTTVFCLLWLMPLLYPLEQRIVCIMHQYEPTIVLCGLHKTWKSITFSAIKFLIVYYSLIVSHKKSYNISGVHVLYLIILQL